MFFALEHMDVLLKQALISESVIKNKKCWEEQKYYYTNEKMFLYMMKMVEVDDFY